MIIILFLMSGSTMMPSDLEFPVCYIKLFYIKLFCISLSIVCCSIPYVDLGRWAERDVDGEDPQLRPGTGFRKYPLSGPGRRAVALS